LYGAFEDPDFHYLVMEYVGGDSLHRWVGMLPSPRVRAIIRGVAEGLRYLHEDCGVVHNDLKPENVLIDDDGRVLITDFGAGARLDGGLSTVAWETAQYHAPELARRDPYGVAVDAWALGALLYHLLRGRPAFDVSDTDQHRLVAAILHDAPDLRGFEPSLHDLLTGLLAKDVAARLMVGEALRHPWLRDPNDGDHPDG
jgi:serine/threonine protein kinase